MTPMAAAKAYGAALKQVGLTAQGGAASQATKSAGPSFSHMLQQAVENTYSATKNAETAMTGPAQGKVELIDAVTAVASAQANLETVISVRDSVINAYQEIMRMPI